MSKQFFAVAQETGLKCLLKHHSKAKVIIGHPYLSKFSVKAICSTTTRSKSRSIYPNLVSLPSQFRDLDSGKRNLLSTRSMCGVGVFSFFSTYVKSKSHYEVLNVSRNASSDEIRQAFITLSKTWHPDRNTDDPTHHKKFVQINEAYSVLSKPLSRRDYDLALDAERYVSRQMSAAASRSHGYGYSPHADAYYHYRHHVYDETYWSSEAHKRSGNISVLANFYMLIACATLATVTFIMHYMYTYLPNPKHHHLRRDLTPEEVGKHDLIMESEQDGDTVYYYAIPKKDSKKYDIMVVRKTHNKDTDEHTLHEVTRGAP